MSDAGATRKVLVVDDRAEMAELIAEDLSQKGYAAVAITSGREAMNRLREERFDAVVTDLRMPEVDGLMLLRASLALDPSRPVIMMTAHGTLDTAMEATGEGAYHYLMKPFRLDDLTRLLEQALRRG